MKLPFIFPFLILFLLPSCNYLWWATDMSSYDIRFYGRLVDQDKSFYPQLSRNDRIYLKYIQNDPKRHANNIPVSTGQIRYNYNLN